MNRKAVTLNLTVEQADLLQKICLFDCTIPEAVVNSLDASVEGFTLRDEESIRELLSAMRMQIFQAWDDEV